MAETTIDQLNDTGSAGVDATLLDRALTKAAKAGDTVFHRLLVKESHLEGELTYLEAFADQDTQAIPESEGIRRSLRRRLLVIEEGGRWRLRAPLMARWLQMHV